MALQTPQNDMEGKSKSNQSAKCFRVVGVDPGYRNLAVVGFDFNIQTHKCTLVSSRHGDIGSCKQDEDLITKMWMYLNLHKPFVGADCVVIENQMIGPSTKPRNQGLAWMIATIALTQSPTTSITFINSKKKFSEFKNIELPHKIRRGEKMGRRVKLKSNAVYLANVLLHGVGIEPMAVFIPGKQKQWEHLADAIGLAFVFLTSLTGSSFSASLTLVPSVDSTKPQLPSSCP
jgi:hypothetical protein